MDGINVLSLFDGISCGRIALERAGIKVNNYFASEIDKHAIKVTQHNYPNTIQLGDVREIKAENLPKIDLLIGGSPCQGFSFAGKGLNFEDPRSKLFFEFARLKNEIKPKYFLLENVKMKTEHQNIISEILGVKPILINSELVSAQSRERLYWTNIPITQQPTDRCILLKDIIEDGFIDRSKAYCIDANYWKGGNFTQYYKKARRQLVFKDKSQTILSTIYKENAKSMLQRKKLGLVISDGDYARKLTPIECERLQTVPDNYTSCVSDTQRYKMLGNGWTVDVIAHIFGSLLNGV
jgi:DNA-cytosine methyltransferase